MHQPMILRSDGLQLSARLYFPSHCSPTASLCICHGIPAVPFNPADEGYSALAQRFADDGFLTLLFNFRGAGLSEGDFDIAGWTRDLDRAVEYLSAHPAADPSRIFVMGFSGGAAAAICVAARSASVRGVVSCASPATFDDLFAGPAIESAIAQWRKIGIIRDPTFPRDRVAWEHGFLDVEPMQHVAHVAPRPLLIIHGDADEVVPAAHASRLYAAAGEPKELAIIPGGAHRLRVNESAMALLALRGCAAQDDAERLRQASAVLRAAVEAESHLDQPRFEAFDHQPCALIATAAVKASARECHSRPSCRPSLFESAWTWLEVLVDEDNGHIQP